MHRKKAAQESGFRVSKRRKDRTQSSRRCGRTVQMQGQHRHMGKTDKGYGSNWVSILALPHLSASVV